MDQDVLALLKLDQVQIKVPLSRSGIYAKIKDGKFPAPISLGGRAVGWLNTEIDAWIIAQAEARSVPRRKSWGCA
ncbi:MULTISPECIES: AlpA family transcriptional regulator [unclassified Duganella]|uniref:helix-turn-helix transcriptional regulator n=1 Tax=unclassified Duganella TaxID=2636909 RepID=UPI0008916DCE|nr:MULTISPECIES: AlpA family phage regulatory protein [unclassified Duganella]SDH07009.1 transcriptional regulator, AlpA family [Duganella sp. OV458]SDK19125.1 transcriptional regulator, AlpA family [Duganella sp. OV510]